VPGNGKRERTVVQRAFRDTGFVETSQIVPVSRQALAPASLLTARLSHYNPDMARI